MGRFEPRWVPLALAAVLMLPGCSDSEGGDTETSDLIPDFRVIANPSGTLAFARLESSTLLNVRLPDADDLRVTAGDQDKLMGYAVDPVNGSYYTTTLVTPDAGQDIVFSVERDGAANAPNSHVSMPTPIQLTAPSVGTVIATGTQVNVSWSPSGLADEVTIVMTTTSCSGGGSTAPHGTLITGDPGTAAVAVPPSILPLSLPFGGSCAVNLRVERTRYGTPDPAFASGGSVIARQVDVRQVFVEPE